MLISQFEKVNGVDFIGRFETYAEDVRYICDKIGVPYMDFKDNGSNHGDYREYYTEETKALATEYFKKDLEVFDYDF